MVPKPKGKRPQRSAQPGQGSATSNVTLTINPTKTEVRINQAQSLHIVQTTVSAALSTILWVNDLFPEDFFESRSYSLDDPTFPFTAKTPAQAAIERKHGEDKARVNWDFLLKGKSTKADKIWLWLNGVCDAIKLRYLASFQISFHNGAVSRDTIVVAYVMKFTYNENGSASQFHISSGNKEVEVTAEDMQDLKNMFQKLLKMSRGTDDFLVDPTISLQLSYNETCPVEYEPRGFVAAPDASIIMNQDGFRIGAIDTTFHSVGMSLITSPETATHNSGGSFRSVPRSNTLQISSQINATPSQATVSCGDTSVLNTQDRTDRQQIRDMIPIRQDVEDTQRLPDTQSQRTSEEHLSQLSPSSEPVEKYTSPPEERKFYFDRDAIRKLHPNHKWRNGQVQISLAEAQEIDCHCTKTFAGMSVQCEICQTKQHLQCYGYLETDVMDTHICYECLLNSELDLLREMQQLCILRQVAWVASMEQYPRKESELSGRLGCTVKEIISLSNRLAKEKYLRKISRPHSKLHKDYHRRSEIQPYEFIIVERERLLKQYLNPTFKIDAYLHEQPQASAGKSQSQQLSPPTLPHLSDSNLSSVPHESSMLAPNSQLPETPHAPRSQEDSAFSQDDSEFVFGIWSREDDTTTPHSASMAESSMNCTTQGTPSHMGSPGPRPSLELKRKADVMEGAVGNTKRSSWVNSPFALVRGRRE
ncbi:hypothetical protein V492_00799 [Pseudogymnoascus sp. VKM F-4246]|nr:hypothetical protein V492_00799 [Pseudogymnoascus sp. VKM F-4246]